MTRHAPILAAAACLALLAPPAAGADVSDGILEVVGWTPTSAAIGDAVVQASPLSGMTLAPMALTAAGHPFDPPGTSGAAARLSFDRPATGDAAYHSFAAGYAFSYTPEPYAKSARTHFDLVGSLRILPPDMARLLGLLPLTAFVQLESSLSLHGRFVAEASGGGQPVNTADTGVRVSRVLNGHNVGGEATLHAEDGADPVLTTSGFLAGDLQARSFGAAELDSMFEGAMTAFGLSSARGAALLSIDQFTETIGFVAGGACQFNPNCAIPYYETPLSFTIETWGDAGLGQSTVAAADLRNTLHFAFTVLDGNGQATDIPVYLALADATGTVDEPGSAALVLASLLVLGRMRRSSVSPTLRGLAP